MFRFTPVTTGRFKPSSNYTGTETAADLNSSNAKSVTVKAKWRANCTTISSAEIVNLSKNGIKNYDYSGTEKCAILSNPGYYKLEVWGAQGGNSGASTGSYIGGFGGYSVGIINSTKNLYLSVVVGGTGAYCTTKGCAANGGYNGGGSSTSYAGEDHDSTAGGGGGATHIAMAGGQLKNLSGYKDTDGNNISKEILIVAGGGGGGNWCNSSNYANGGHGGGFQSVNAIDIGAPHFNINAGGRAIATQTNGYAFGLGGSGTDTRAQLGGGGGWYGGIGSGINGAPGGSGYIGSSNLISGGGITKHMTCYSCTTSTADATHTISNTNVSATAIADYSKTGNRYARITYLGTSI